MVNAASYKDPRLPGANIAPGSIFIVTGSGLGPANIAVAPAAFQSTSLSGTSVKVTVNATTVNALMYYTSATQAAALLSSNTPPGGVGTGSPNAQVTITVTYNGEESVPTLFQGVANGAGIFTVASSGSGPTGPKGAAAAVTSSGDRVVFNDPTQELIGSKYAGSYIFAGGPGNDVGAFTTQLTVPLVPTFTSPLPGLTTASS